jgi:hypothetical protein
VADESDCLTIFSVYSSQYFGFACCKCRISLRGQSSLRPHDRSLRNVCEFPRPVRRILCGCVFLRENLCPCESCRPHCLDLFRETNDLDCNSAYYRSDDTRVALLVFPQKYPRRLCDERILHGDLTGMPHIHFDKQKPSTPNISSHCKKFLRFLYQLSPKIFPDLSVLESSYQRASTALGQSPTVTAVRGILFPNCNTVQGWRYGR